MSKTDDYQKAKTVAAAVKQNLMQALGRDNAGTRHFLEARCTGNCSDSWAQAVLWLHASHEHRGSSRCHSNISREVAEYLVKAINENMPSLAVRAIALAEADVETARKEASSEAKEVLQPSRVSV